MGFGRGWKRKSKYGASKVEIDGHKFDSQAEAEYYGILKGMQSGGLLRIIELQPKVYMTDARILYKPDFLIEIDGEKKYVDVKGMKTPVFQIKARLWRHYGEGILQIVEKTRGGFKIKKEIETIKRNGE